MDKKINAKDLINVGIFTAIYFVVFFACGMLGYIPIFMVALPLPYCSCGRDTLYALFDKGQ